MSVVITEAEFKTFFDRGQFAFGSNLPEVRDKDITEAIEEAELTYNKDLYPDEDTCRKALMYLIAHYLTLDIEAADSGGQSNFIQTSRSANGISESINIPEWMNEGEFAMYATTFYGQKFIILSKPYLDGAVYSVRGSTNP
jgi:hypothetical protein